MRRQKTYFCAESRNAVIAIDLTYFLCYNYYRVVIRYVTT